MKEADLATADAEDTKAEPSPKGSKTLEAEVRRFGHSALLYLIPSVLARGISFFLTPFYTRVMSPADFAIISVVNTVGTVLGIVLSFALYGCIPRLCVEYAGLEQRKVLGTILAFLIVVPSALVALLFGLGGLGHLDFFQTIRFTPHIELTLWSSLFAVYAPLPIAVYSAREQPGKVAVLTLSSAVAQVLAAIYFVAVLHQGAVGVLRASAAANGLLAVVSIVVMLRMSTFDPRLPGLRQALAFSLPLVPHLSANWILSISDRLVLEKYVPSTDIGNYSLGYVFCLGVNLIASSVTGALSPMANRQLKDPQLAGNVPRLGTYALFFMVVVSLATSLGANEALTVIAPPAYAPAARVVPWVVLGALFQGLYYIVSIGTWFSMKTRLVPVITAIAAALNIGINLAFVPRYGFMVAAISTAISYGVLAMLHARLAQSSHPIAWEYGRWALLFGVAGACYVIGKLPLTTSLGLTLLWKAVVLVLVFPIGLVLTRFFTQGELARVHGALRRFRTS